MRVRHRVRASLVGFLLLDLGRLRPFFLDGHQPQGLIGVAVSQHRSAEPAQLEVLQDARRYTDRQLDKSDQASHGASHPQQANGVGDKPPLAVGREPLIEKQPDKSRQPRQHLRRRAARIDENEAGDGTRVEFAQHALERRKKPPQKRFGSGIA